MRAFWGVVLLAAAAGRWHLEGGGDDEDAFPLKEVTDAEEQERAEAKQAKEDKLAAERQAEAERQIADEKAAAEAQKALEEKTSEEKQAAEEAEKQRKAAEEAQAERAPQAAISPTPADDNSTAAYVYPGRVGEGNFTIVTYANGTGEADYHDEAAGEQAHYHFPNEAEEAEEEEDEDVRKAAAAEKAKVAREKAERDKEVARLEASIRADEQHPHGLRPLVPPEDQNEWRPPPPQEEGEPPPAPKERFAPELPSQTSTTTLAPGATPPPTPPGWVDLVARPELRGQGAVEVNPEPSAKALHGPTPPEPRGPDLICSAGDDITYQQCQGLPISDCLPPCYTLSRTKLAQDDPGVRLSEDAAPLKQTDVLSGGQHYAEREALLELLAGIGLPTTQFKGDPPCQWPGVQCAAPDGYFIDLAPSDEDEAGLNGKLEPGQYWFHLPQLKVLRIVGTNLTGPLPAELGAPKSLKAIDLSGNRLTGRIPQTLGYLPNLKVLHLAYNELTGPIPPVLGHLPHLKALNLAANDITGRVPAELGQPPLERLHLFRNRLQGPLPPKLGDLEYLREFSVHDNTLTGTLPPELGQMRSLEKLALSYNLFTGQLPRELGCLPQLEKLWVQGNQLTGRIPATLGLLDNAEELLLSRNLFTGTVPFTLSRLARCETLVLSRNRLSGSAPDWLGCMPSLETVGLSGQDKLAPGGTMQDIEERIEEMAPGWAPPSDSAAANRAGYWRIRKQWKLEDHLDKELPAGALPDDADPGSDRFEKTKARSLGSDWVVDKEKTKALSQEDREDGWRVMRLHPPKYPPTWTDLTTMAHAPRKLQGLMPHMAPVPVDESLAQLSDEPAPVTASRRRCNPPKMFSASGSWTDPWAPGTTQRAELRRQLQCDRRPEAFVPANPLR